MLKNIQIKIVLIFLIIGVLAIGIMGYINYTNLQSSLNILEGSNIDISSYQTNLKMSTITTIIIFTLICILARSFYK